MAAICSPTPALPSYCSPWIHLRPQALFAPLHCCAAAWAEARSLGTSRSCVNGAICVVAAIQREEYALNERWSTLQRSIGSQPTSLITLALLGKKMSKLAMTFSTRVFQVSDLLVC